MENLKKLPNWLSVILVIVALFAILTLVKPVARLFPYLDSFALIVTLAVLIIYTYFTYQVRSVQNK